MLKGVNGAQGRPLAARPRAAPIVRAIKVNLIQSTDMLPPALDKPVGNFRQLLVCLRREVVFGRCVSGLLRSNALACS